MAIANRYFEAWGEILRVSRNLRSTRVHVHSYVLAKVEEQGKLFWLQANTEYPERDTEVDVR